MKDNYGNRYRFYEIIQAHKNGEDLSQFTPKNKPEEDLIAELTGAAGGSTMPDSPFNNPNLRNLYYGMTLSGKTKFVFDFSKFAEALDATDSSILDSTPVNGSGSGFGIDLFNFVNPGGAKSDVRLYFSTDFVQYYITNYNDAAFDCNANDIRINWPSSASTYREGFTALGKVEFDMKIRDGYEFVLFNINKTYFEEDNNCEPGANLNTTPIEYMWFE